MAAKSSPRRAKRSKNIDTIKRKNMTANLQWAAISIVVLLFLIAIFVFGWGTGDGLVQNSG